MPGAAYSWPGVAAVSVVASPKSQLRPVRRPVDWSLNSTASGAQPRTGWRVNAATGTSGASTVTVTCAVSGPQLEVAISRTA